jgi:hypothetical protein
LLLTLGGALAYATQHSPWTTVERVCKPDATCSQGKGACGARLDASGGGRAVTVVVARHASGPAGFGGEVVRHQLLHWKAGEHHIPPNYVVDQ